MKKIINCLKDHWVIVLISIILTISGLIDLVMKYLKGNTSISSFMQSALGESVIFYSQKTEIIRIFILIPWAVALSLCILVVRDCFQNKRGYKDVYIYFIGKKLIIRFRDRNSSKEYADARIICGYCRLLFDELKGGRQRCQRCGLGYNQEEAALIIAEARSKWITGKRQAGYIKTGKPREI